MHTLRTNNKLQNQNPLTAADFRDHIEYGVKNILTPFIANSAIRKFDKFETTNPGINH